MSEHGDERGGTSRRSVRRGWGLRGLGLPSVALWFSFLVALPGAAPARGLTPTQPLTAYGRQSWQTDSGLPQSTVHAVLQSRDGFLWIATEGGLVRYDGAEMRVFNTANTPTLTSDTINDLAEDAAGDLWIATADGLIERSAGSTRLRRFSAADGLPSDVIRGLRVVASGGAKTRQRDRLIVLTAGGMAVSREVAANGAARSDSEGTFRTSGGPNADSGTAQERLFRAVSGLEGDTPTRLVEADAQGMVWVALANGGVRSLAPGQSASQYVCGIPVAIGEVQAIAIDQSSSSSSSLSPASASTSDLAIPAPKTLWLGGTNGLAGIDLLQRASSSGVEAGINSTSQRVRLVQLPPSSQVTALLATPGGVLWIGTNVGVLRYREALADAAGAARSAAAARTATDAVPGAAARSMTMRTTTPDRTIGLVAVASISGSSLSLGRVLKLVRDREGSIWVAGEHALSRILDDAGGPQMEAALNVPGVLAITEDREGDVWLGSDSDGLTVLRQRAVHTLTRADGLSKDFVRAILAARDGSVWIGTDGGLNSLAPNGEVASRQGSSQGRQNSEASQDSQGSEGLDGRITPLRRLLTTGKQAGLLADALTSHVILALAESPSDAAMTGAGIHAKQDAPARRAAAGEHTVLWIGTPDGLARLEDGHTRIFTTADGLPDDFVRSLYADRDGSLWIGTRNGLSHLVHGRFVNYSRLDGLGSELIGTVLRTKARGGDAGTLWVGTLGGLSRFDGTGFKNFTHADGLAGDAITTLAEDSSGTLWIASHNAGLTRYKDGVFAAVGLRAAGLPLEIFSVLQRTNGPTTRPAGAASAGKEAGSTAGNEATAALWLGTSQGIDRVSLAALNALAEGRAGHTSLTHFGVADGMAISECSSGGHPAAAVLADGSLWFATRRGIATLRPGLGEETRLPPLVAIEEVSVDDRSFEPVEGGFGAGFSTGERLSGGSIALSGESVSPGSRSESDSTYGPDGTAEVTLAPGENRLAIHYAGLSFTAPSQVRFRYRMVGFDRAWIEAGGRRTAYYTNLPPGRYRFEVMAESGDGEDGEVGGIKDGGWSLAPASLLIRQRPHLYQTVWFYLMLLLAASGLIVALYRWRTGQAHRQYQMILDERTRIAREIHDTLAQGYVGVSIQLELISRLLRRKGTKVQAASGDGLEADGRQMEAAAAQVEATKELVRASLAEARSSIWQLRAGTESSGHGQTLPDRIAAALERLRLLQPSEARLEAASRPGATVRMEVRGTARALDRRCEDELVRIAEEALANAVRHAEAREIVVTLSYAARSLTLRVADDGRGFAADGIPDGHFGLRGIRERATAIGAVLHLESKPAGSEDAGAAAGSNEAAIANSTREQSAHAGLRSGTIVEVHCPLDAEDGGPHA